MFGFIVRRLPAALILAALVGLAAPAVAAPPSWPLSHRVHGMGWLDQVAAWIAHLWRGDEPQEQSPLGKGLIPAGGMLGGGSSETTNFERRDIAGARQ